MHCHYACMPCTTLLLWYDYVSNIIVILNDSVDIFQWKKKLINQIQSKYSILIRRIFWKGSVNNWGCS